MYSKQAVARRQEPTNLRRPLHFHNLYAFDNGGTGIVDAIHHRL